METQQTHSQIEFTGQQLVDAAEVQRILAQPKPWLAEASGEAGQARTETSPAQELTTEEMQQRERDQDHLSQRSPWL